VVSTPRAVVPLDESHDSTRGHAEVLAELALVRERLKAEIARSDELSGHLAPFISLGRWPIAVARRLASLRDAFPQATSCLRRIVRGNSFNARDAVRIAVVSTPRSGNTWLRHLLCDLYGLEPLVLDAPSDRDWETFPQRCLLQIHYHRSEEFVRLLDRHGFRVVTMARHPLDILISILHFANADARTHAWLYGEGGDERPIIGAKPRSEAFLSYATGPRARALLGITAEWWRRPGVHSLRYHDLVADPVAELARLVDELGLRPRIDPADAAAMSSRDRMRSKTSANHVWKGTPGHWRRLLTTHEARRIINVHRDLFEALNYGCDPDPDLDGGQADDYWFSQVLGPSFRAPGRPASPSSAPMPISQSDLDALTRELIASNSEGGQEPLALLLQVISVSLAENNERFLMRLAGLACEACEEISDGGIAIGVEPDEGSEWRKSRLQELAGRAQADQMSLHVALDAITYLAQFGAESWFLSEYLGGEYYG
jgi:hypothetical protein